MDYSKKFGLNSKFWSNLICIPAIEDCLSSVGSNHQALHQKEKNKSTQKIRVLNSVLIYPTAKKNVLELAKATREEPRNKFNTGTKTAQKLKTIDIENFLQSKSKVMLNKSRSICRKKLKSTGNRRKRILIFSMNVFHIFIPNEIF